MRRGFLVFLLVALLITFLLIRSVWTLLSLLVEDASADAIIYTDLLPPSSSINAKPELIPRIIHQTYKNETIPEVWIDAQKSCLEQHPDYEYKLWTDEKSREFIAVEYPWFLETFDSYEYPIQRADSIRYFVLAYYGGIYIDLDDGCNRRLDPLLTYPAWLRRTVPTGISNDVMGAMPQHPFFLRAIESLKKYDHHWVLPYITVMYSTGPLFLSVIWKEYIMGRPESEMNRVHVLMPDEYKKQSWSFFTHHVGNSWHDKDARFIFWMGEHWIFITFCGFLLAAVLGVCLSWGYRRSMVLLDRHRCNSDNASGIDTRFLSSSRSRRIRRSTPPLLPTSNFKGDHAADLLRQPRYRQDW